MVNRKTAKINQDNNRRKASKHSYRASTSARSRHKQGLPWELISAYLYLKEHKWECQPPRQRTVETHNNSSQHNLPQCHHLPLSPSESTYHGLLLNKDLPQQARQHSRKQIQTRHGIKTERKRWRYRRPSDPRQLNHKIRRQKMKKFRRDSDWVKKTARKQVYSWKSREMDSLG